MSHSVYIEGDLFIQRGVMYTKGMTFGAPAKYKKDAQVLVPENGVLTITQDYGSMFTMYYVAGYVTFAGSVGYCLFFGKDNHEETYKLYNNNIRLILQLLNNATIPNGIDNLFYQQQLISVFGALELYLYQTFMLQVCSNYEIYQRVIKGKIEILEKHKKSRNYKILSGEDCLDKEKVFIQKVQKIIYHRSKDVDDLFSIAFNIRPNISSLENEISLRHDLVHRMGYNIQIAPVIITKEQVISLIDKVNLIVKNISTEIFKLNGNELV